MVAMDRSSQNQDYSAYEKLSSSHLIHSFIYNKRANWPLTVLYIKKYDVTTSLQREHARMGWSCTTQQCSACSNIKVLSMSMCVGMRVRMRVIILHS